jgi:hypothetical protein
LTQPSAGSEKNLNAGSRESFQRLSAFRSDVVVTGQRAEWAFIGEGIKVVNQKIFSNTESASKVRIWVHILFALFQRTHHPDAMLVFIFLG